MKTWTPPVSPTPAGTQAVSLTQKISDGRSIKLSCIDNPLKTFNGTVSSESCFLARWNPDLWFKKQNCKVTRSINQKRDVFTVASSTVGFLASWCFDLLAHITLFLSMWYKRRNWVLGKLSTSLKVHAELGFYPGPFVPPRAWILSCDAGGLFPGSSM